MQTGYSCSIRIEAPNLCINQLSIQFCKTEVASERKRLGSSTVELTPLLQACPTIQLPFQISVHVTQAKKLWIFLTCFQAKFSIKTIFGNYVFLATSPKGFSAFKCDVRNSILFISFYIFLYFIFNILFCYILFFLILFYLILFYILFSYSILLHFIFLYEFLHILHT